ncbi:MAG: ABC transporter permease [Planctomycetota bacterium]|nr:ABC transporter permease [Planctomycetota bacterium]
MIRIAITMLIGSRVKFIGVITGILFTSLLITHFQAIFCGIMTRTFAMIADNQTVDVWVMDPAVEYIDEVAKLPSPSLERVRSVDGVQWATRLFTGSLRTRLPGGRFRSADVIGVDDATLIGLPAKVIEGTAFDVRQPDSVLVDRDSARTLLRPAIHGGGSVTGGGDENRVWGVGVGTSLETPTRPLTVGDEVMINDHRVRVVGVVEILPRFIKKGVFYTTYTNAVRLAPPERNQLSYVLVKVREGEQATAVARRIEKQTGLKALTRDEFAATTIWYYIKNTDIVGQIGMMTIIAVSVGVSITGLLLSMFTAENLRYYGMLMATGATTRTLLSMVAAQAVAAGLIGFGLGIGASCVLGFVMSGTGLPYRLMWPTFLITGVFVIVVCVLSAIVSARQAVRLEPGIVFRG